jgi:cysteine-rich repeat protein
MVCATFAGGCMCVQGPILCGNGTSEPGEGCEDGNTIDGDGCDSNCTPTACGNGIATAGEECDGSDDGACLAGCQPDCTCTSVPPTPSQIGCFIAIGKGGGKFVKGKLKLLQSCKERELRAPGSCAAPDPAAVAKLESKLAAGLAKQCSLAPPAFHNMGFPGPCADSNPLDGFTTADLIDCIVTSHNAILDDLLTVEYDPTNVGPLMPAVVPCQSALGQAGARVLFTVVKSVQKCRNAILKGKLPGPPTACATSDPKTLATITKVRDKAVATIMASCSDADAATLKACTPDQLTAPTAATCLVQAHTDAADNPNSAAPADLLDYEYATGTAGVCGDNVVNQAAEECDGSDDLVCPGLCLPDCTCP